MTVVSKMHIEMVIRLACVSAAQAIYVGHFQSKGFGLLNQS